MSRKVVLRAAVPGDLHATVEYLDRNNTPAADRFVESVFATFDEVAAQPGIGSPKHLATHDAVKRAVLEPLQP